MRVYRVQSDVNRYRFVVGMHDEDSTLLAAFDGTPRAQHWTPPSVRVFAPRLKVGDFSLLDCQFMTEHLASLGAVSVPRETYVALLSAALGGGVAVGVPATGAPVEAPPRAAEASPDFAALDRLLELAGAAGAGGPEGYVIAQLLGHTS